MLNVHEVYNIEALKSEIHETIQNKHIFGTLIIRLLIVRNGLMVSEITSMQIYLHSSK